jgi:glycosyltransferase involved in cell wall biosynthesis
MPFFNTREAFFLEAVESVYRQSYIHWELLLVDDGSEPSFSNIAQRFAGQNTDKIKYLEHEDHRNLGISTSRNLGISVACGEFIAFLDADDVWDDCQLEEQIELFSKNPRAAMLYGNTTYWHTWKGEEHGPVDDIQYRLGAWVDQLVEPPLLLRRFLQRLALPPNPSTTIFRRRIFEDGESFEDAFKAHYEDQVFFAKVAAKYPIYVSGRSWGWYRQSAEQITAGGQNSDVAREWRLRYLLWLASYLQSIGLQDRVLWSFLRLETLTVQHRGVELVTDFLRRWLGRLRRLLMVFQRA